jgi:6-pyruvoyltetrahydropterin/6-carboxytetrahydropterin synthase
MMEIFKEFAFDAAHNLAANVAPGHAYARMHGHSFQVGVYIRGEPDPKTGWIVDLAEIDKALAGVKARLDHRLLNEIEGLGTPTLENLARWIWRELTPSLPALSRIVIRRSTLAEGCVLTADKV